MDNQTPESKLTTPEHSKLTSMTKRKSNTAAPSVDPPRLVRLSDPQKTLLANLAAGDTAAPGYKPAEKLIGYGLAEIREGKWSGDRVIISDAGRSYFEANAKAMRGGVVTPKTN